MQQGMALGLTSDPLSPASASRLGESRQSTEQTPAVPSLPPSAVRQFTGPLATEAFIHVVPDPGDPDDAYGQTVAVYRKLRAALVAIGASWHDVVRESVFFRNIEQHGAPFCAARAWVLELLEGRRSYHPASTFIEQPPLSSTAQVEVMVKVISPESRQDLPIDAGGSTNGAGSALLNTPSVRSIVMGDETHIFASNMLGVPGTSDSESASRIRSTPGRR